MLHYLYADQLHTRPLLRDTMFRDRTTQFRDRMGWDVEVDHQGFERDEYDDLNPLYVIASDADGRHAGSLRLLPTTGQTMVNDHFLDVMGGAPLVSPEIWECTRFCLGPNGKPTTAAALMLAGGEVLQGFGISHFVGVFDAPMLRIYKAIGSSPDVLGTKDGISVGLWSFTPNSQSRVAKRAKVLPAQSRAWFEAAFGPEHALEPA